jgi:hypothetical protein
MIGLDRCAGKVKQDARYKYSRNCGQSVFDEFCPISLLITPCNRYMKKLNFMTQSHANLDLQKMVKIVKENMKILG